MTNSYHSTTNETAAETEKSEQEARSQERTILVYLKLHPFENFTADELRNKCELMNFPITSIRRALTNLADEKRWNEIEKTNIQRHGVYGKMTSCWQLRRRIVNGQLLMFN